MSGEQYCRSVKDNTVYTMKYDSVLHCISGFVYDSFINAVLQVALGKIGRYKQPGMWYCWPITGRDVKNTRKHLGRPVWTHSGDFIQTLTCPPPPPPHVNPRCEVTCHTESCQSPWHWHTHTHTRVPGRVKWDFFLFFQEKVLCHRPAPHSHISVSDEVTQPTSVHRLTPLLKQQFDVSEKEQAVSPCEKFPAQSRLQCHIGAVLLHECLLMWLNPLYSISPLRDALVECSHWERSQPSLIRGLERPSYLLLLLNPPLLSLYGLLAYRKSWLIS